MIALENILSQEIIQKLGWTLLHFIWQAAVVALLLAILLRVLRKSTANLRYIIASLALALIVLLPVITIKLVPVSVPQKAIHIEPAPAPIVLPALEMPAAETIIVEEPEQHESVTPISADPWTQRAVGALEPALPYIVLGWLIGVFGLSLWHLGGWTQLQRLKRRMVKQVDDTLHSKLKVLAQRLRVKQAVQLMESALVQIPTVVGWLRPVILLPASALTGLSSEQLEAILAHELAHIRRCDYLINILQTIVEILGFYHPAVWWVSHKIRTERENCCDDLAVSISGDRVCYAGALTSMEEIRAGRSQLAVAASGGNLSRRICRLVGKDSAEKTSFSWIPAVTVILLVIALAIPATITLTARAQEKPEGLAGDLIDGFRANRDKFKCGVLAWSRKTINDRYADSNHPGRETEGEYKMWWDGKKIATKYVQDEVVSDPTGRVWVEKRRGSNSYDGGLLSRKPRFGLYENWLQQVIRWQGHGSLDNMILMLKKQKHLTISWSIVDVDDSRMFKLFAKNMDETGSDYGAYSVEYYDPSKGYGLVNQEWYNSDGQLRMKHTVKLEQVIPDGWFPVEVDFKSFNRTQGTVRLHQRFVLDMKRCSFNDRSAIPKGIFEFSTAKEHEQLDKILEKFSNRAPAGPPDTSDNNGQLVRESVENFIAAALAGEDEKAATLAYPDTAVAEQIDDMREALQGQQVRIVGICAGDWNASAISSVIQGDHGRIGPLLFHTKKVILDQKVHWLIDDIDLETLDTIEREIADFLSKNPEAKTVIVTPRRPTVSPDLSAGKETDVSFEDDILIATEQEKELSANRFPVPVPAKSPAPSAQDKTIIQVDCLIVEVSLDSKMDRETTIVAENLLGNKISLRDTKLDALLRKAAGATAAIKDKSAEHKRVTQDQFKALVDMLTSKGYLRILMNPRIQVVDGKTAKITSAQKISSTQESIEDSIQITPHVFADGHIILQVEAAISSKSIPKGVEQIPTITTREVSTLVTTSPGESLMIIGGLKETEKSSETESNVKDSEKQTTEVLFILTPTIVNSTTGSQEKTNVQIKGKSTESADKLKRLGLAVIMYADDHDNKLADTLEALKPYIDNEQKHQWILDNVEYLGKDITYRPNRARIPVAYDKTLKEQQSGTNVLFLDGHVEFVTTQRLSELYMKRAEFLIETWFLAVTEDFIQNLNHNADSPDEATELLKLKSELLATVDGPNKLSFIAPDRNINLLLKAVRAHKDSKVLAVPQVLALEGKTAEIRVLNNETYYVSGYTEPNRPSEEPQPIVEKVEEGITLSLRPNLTSNKNIDMQFESIISQFLDFEERKFDGKGPYKPPKVRRTTQTSRYIAENGQTLLLGGNKIADRQDGQTEQKYLLVLIKAQTVGSYAQDKSAQVEDLTVAEPGKTTGDVIVQPGIVQSRIIKPNENLQEKTKAATAVTSPDESAEPNEPVVTVNLNNVEMKTIIEKLAEWTGKVIIPAAELMKHKITITIYPPQKLPTSKAVTLIYSALRIKGYTAEETEDAIFLKPEAKPTEVPTISDDEPFTLIKNKDQIVQKFFKLRYYSPSQMARIIKPLLSHTGHISTYESTNSLLIIDTPENLKRIELIIAEYDVPKAEQTVTEIFEIRYGDPVEIVDLLKKLINGRPGAGAIIEQSKQPIVLIPEPRRKWIIAKGSPENMKQIGEWIAKLDREEPAKAEHETVLIKYANVGEVASRLNEALQKMPGSELQTGVLIQPLEKARQIVIFGKADMREMVKKLITEIDIPSGEFETRTFKLKYADPDQIKEHIDNLYRETVSTGPSSYYHYKYGRGSQRSAADTVKVISYPKLKQVTVIASPENMIKIAEQIKEWDVPLDVEQVKTIKEKIGELKEKLVQEEPVPASLEQIEQQSIKQRKILKMRQDCINNDPVVKALSENVANAEKELIVARQKLADSHPEVRQKVEFLKVLTKRLDERIKEVGKSFDDTMLPEPNLPLAPEVPLISSTFIDYELSQALKDIGSMAGIPIIPDETVVGLVTTELKDVPLDTALDIVLIGTPYVVKKTPYYYLVSSAVEPPEIQKRVYSAKKLSNLGKALLIYANDHDDKYPDSLHHLSEYLNLEDLKWVLANVKYLAHGMTIAVRPDIVIAYDKTLLAERKGTNVLFNDSHVEFVKPERLKELGISATEIMIETVFLSVSEDYLKYVGLDANTENFSDGWTRHLAAKYPAGPNGQPYGLIIDDIHVRFLLKTVQAHHDSKALVAPRVRTRAGTTTDIGITQEYQYIKGYNEPNNHSDEPQTKRDKVTLGPHIWLTPKLTEYNRNFKLDLKLELRQLKGIIEGKYKGKYPYYKPIIDVISSKMPCTIPDGKIMLIGGLKINEHIKKEPGTGQMKKLFKEPGAIQLKDLPLIGAAFSSNDKIKDQKMLLILVKPIINPRQKAGKILRGQEDSEEHIKSLARQLEKKLNRPAD